MSPRLVTEVVVVFRTFPIRVAGQQAGPLKEEITWEQVRRQSGYPHEIEERTSVTNKIRRVGRFDWDLAKKAVEVNRPTYVAINHLDYLNHSNRGLDCWEGLSPEATDFIKELDSKLGVPPRFLGTGPRLCQIFESDSQVIKRDTSTQSLLLQRP